MLHSESMAMEFQKTVVQLDATIYRWIRFLYPDDDATVPYQGLRQINVQR